MILDMRVSSREVLHWISLALRLVWVSITLDELMVLWWPLLGDREGVVVHVATSWTKAGIDEVPLGCIMARLIEMGVAPLLTTITTHDGLCCPVNLIRYEGKGKRVTCKARERLIA